MVGLGYIKRDMENIKKLSLLIIWVVVCMIVITEMCYLLTYPSTIANIVGFLGLVSFVLFSYCTKCFTKNKFKLTNKNNEK